MPRLVFLGPPGAGKGTQAARIASELGFAHLSTGDLLRAAVKDRTELGQEADRYMRAGELVPDALVLRLLEERLQRSDAQRGFLLDGFPRTRAQAEALDRLAEVERVIYFDIPETVLVERLTQRLSCPTCGTIYNMVTRPPRSPGRCDHDGSGLVHRVDDRPEAVATRLDVYRQQTTPLLGYYRQGGRLVSVDATGSPDDVSARIRRAIEPSTGLPPT